MSSQIRSLGFLAIALLPALGRAQSGQCPANGWAQFCGPVSDVGQKQFNACMARCEAEWGPAQCGGLARPETCWSYTCDSGVWKQQSVKPGAGCTVGGVTGVCSKTGTCAPSGNAGGPGIGDIPNFTATVGNPIQSPEFVNLYWDAKWDLDNPSLPKASIDAFTAAMASSSYFTAPAVSTPPAGGSISYLTEYGVGSATFGGGFLPSQDCPQRAPSRPGLWDPVNPSIMGFLQCEIDHGGLPKGGNVIYNIILPAYSIEQDFFGIHTLCGSQTAWHFHDTPYDPLMTAAIAAASFHLATLDPKAALADILAILAVDNNGPVWTISMTSTECQGSQGFTTNLLHEMIEAATDPFPPVNVVLGGGNGEIADQCENPIPNDPFAGTTTSRFADPASAGTLPSGNGSVPFATSSVIGVPTFWSNRWQRCSTGFADSSVPGTPAVKIISGQGGTLSMTIAASSGDFGFLPPSFPAGNMVTLPYIGLQDLTQGWEAGNLLDSDQITLNLSWPSPTGPPPTITVTGVGRPGMNLTMKSGDQLSVWVCNPQSGNCAATSAIGAPAGPYLPNLAVQLALFHSPVPIAPYVTFSIDGKPAGSLFGDGNFSGWTTLSIGSHTVSASVPADKAGLYKISYAGACNANGVVSLNEGDNRTCDVAIQSSLAPKSTGCATGETCCEPGVTQCSVCTRLRPGASCPQVK